MFESPQHTTVKSKYFKQHPCSLNQKVQKMMDFEMDFFAPIFRTNKQQCQKAQLTLSRDKIQTVGRIYHQYLKNQGGLPQPYDQDGLLYNSINNGQNSPYQQTNISAFSAPQKPSFISLLQQAQLLDLTPTSSSTQILVINSSLQSYSTPLDSLNPEILIPNNMDTLKYHLLKAKQQTQKLKDENLKLRLEKVKLAAKTSKNQTLRIVPLKIQYQKLQKDIEKLIKEKEFIQNSLRLRANQNNESNLGNNDIAFQSIRHITGKRQDQSPIKYNKKLSYDQNEGSICSINKLPPCAYNSATSQRYLQSPTKRNQQQNQRQSQKYPQSPTKCNQQQNSRVMDTPILYQPNPTTLPPHLSVLRSHPLVLSSSNKQQAVSFPTSSVSSNQSTSMTNNRGCLLRRDEDKSVKSNTPLSYIKGSLKSGTAIPNVYKTVEYRQQKTANGSVIGNGNESPVATSYTAPFNKPYQPVQSAKKNNQSFSYQPINKSFNVTTASYYASYNISSSNNINGNSHNHSYTNNSNNHSFPNNVSSSYSSRNIIN